MGKSRCISRNLAVVIYAALCYVHDALPDPHVTVRMSTAGRRAIFYKIHMLLHTLSSLLLTRVGIMLFLFRCPGGKGVGAVGSWAGL